MNKQITKEEAQRTSANFRAKLDNLKLRQQDLPEAAKMDIATKLSQADTMILAFERDAKELEQSSGADLATVQDLGKTIEQTLYKMQHEIDFLSLGNPTTVDSALDATDHLVEKAAEVIKTVTAKVHLPTPGEKN